MEALTSAAEQTLGNYVLRSLDTGEAPISRSVNSTVALTRK
jgi:hypothetical protein